jgi:hypothetical protein
MLQIRSCSKCPLLPVPISANGLGREEASRLLFLMCAY